MHFFRPLFQCCHFRKLLRLVSIRTRTHMNSDCVRERKTHAGTMQCYIKFKLNVLFQQCEKYSDEEMYVSGIQSHELTHKNAYYFGT